MARWSEEPRFLVKHVVSADYASGTHADVYESVESFNSLARLREDLKREHRCEASVSGKGIGRDENGRHNAFRWSWEWKLPYGTRQSDTLFVKVLSWH